VKLLLDENLSDRIVPQILDLFPASAHVKSFGLERTDDGIIWTFARDLGFTIVSKDSDFHQRSLLFGAPPKFIFLRAGNCSTDHIVALLCNQVLLISSFLEDSDASVLVLA